MSRDRAVLTSGRVILVGDYEASTTVDVASNVLFEYLKDVEHLPEYLPQLTALHRTGESPEGERVEVEAVVHPGVAGERTVEGEAWIDVVEDGKKLRWGAPGPHEYHGELDVDFVADGTSTVTVRLHTEHIDGPSVEDALQRTLASLKAAAERTAARPRSTPGA
jgi:hypothetical protein